MVIDLHDSIGLRCMTRNGLLKRIIDYPYPVYNTTSVLKTYSKVAMRRNHGDNMPPSFLELSG